MYHFYPALSHASVAAGSILLAIIGYLIVGCVVVSYFVSIAMLVRSAKNKGHHRDGAIGMWFIGIFMTPIVLGLYVAGLPDKTRRPDPAPAVQVPEDRSEQE